MSTGDDARHRGIGVLLLAAVVVAAACSSPATLPTPVGVATRVDTSWYEVEGLTPRAWNVSMDQRAPLAGVAPRYHAETRWTTRWSYASTRVVRNGCEAVGPVAQAQVVFIVPRLRSDSLATPEARAEWRRYSTSLLAHESGHAARGLRAAAGQLESLRHLRTPRCEQFGPEAQRATAAVIDRYKALDREYDDRTQHGRRQGAFLIVNPLAPLAVDTTYRDTIP